MNPIQFKFRSKAAQAIVKIGTINITIHVIANDLVHELRKIRRLRDINI